MGSLWTRAQACVPCVGRRICNHCATREAQRSLKTKKKLSLTVPFLPRWVGDRGWVCQGKGSASLTVSQGAVVGGTRKASRTHFRQKRECIGPKEEVKNQPLDRTGRDRAGLQLPPENQDVYTARILSLQCVFIFFHSKPVCYSGSPHELS